MKLETIAQRRLLVFVALFLLAATVRTIRLSGWGECMRPDAESNEISRIAHSLAVEGTFANPYIVPTGPTAHHAPMFPLLLAAIYKMVSPAAWLEARTALNIILASLSCAAIFSTGCLSRFPPAAGLLAAILASVIPPRLAVEICTDQEAGLSTLVGTIAAGASAYWLDRRGARPGRGDIWIGALAGFSLLTAPVFLPVIAAVLAVALWNREPGRASIAACAALLVIAPWMVRNRIVTGEWFFIRDNFGLELRVSNADNAVADASRNASQGGMQTYHPLFSREAAIRVATAGEVREYSRLGAEAFDWIRLNPALFRSLTIERIRNFWIPIGSSRSFLAWRVLSAILALAGLVFAVRRCDPNVVPIVAMLLLYPLPFYLLQSYGRYGYPIEWCVTLLGSYGAVELVRQARSMEPE